MALRAPGRRPRSRRPGRRPTTTTSYTPVEFNGFIAYLPGTGRADRQARVARPAARSRSTGDARRQRGGGDEQQRLEREHRGIGRRRRAEQRACDVARRGAEQAAEAARRSPARRPTGPCACLRAPLRPSPARLIIEPMAAIANAPLASAEHEHVGAQRPVRRQRAAQHQTEQRQRRGDAAADHPGAQRAEASRLPRAGRRARPAACRPARRRAARPTAASIRPA